MVHIDKIPSPLDESALDDILVYAIKTMTPLKKKKLADYAASLVKENRIRKRSYLSLSWAGGLKDLRAIYTSVDLEKKASL
ncbi:MAG: hypothetical protein K9W43_07445 [Candidatus Thorarchaeota archaeon]|nr:hypothetical protein [Candidatus Thorarchaeota archaeon]